MRDAEPSSLLDVEDLGVWLGRRQVLDVTRLRIERGVIIMLSGDNGSGKTTLLKCLAGLLPVRRARFRCLGMDMNRRTAARFCRGRHIYLHQTPYMFDGTVEENVAYGLKQRGRDLAQRRVEIRDALEWAGLAHLVHRPAKTLSTGEKQRVALTRARILSPSLLLLDEITANMDADSRRRAYDLIADLRRGGSSVVFATHDHEPVESICDAHYVLTEGTLSERRVSAASVIPLRRDGARPAN